MVELALLAVVMQKIFGSQLLGDRNYTCAPDKSNERWKFLSTELNAGGDNISYESAILRLFSQSDLVSVYVIKDK